ncbi:MAG: hypothetical protein JXM70_01450 [Pirellulales bacterium]|nr:hypothetical protein [Pirellulales bacterium]
MTPYTHNPNHSKRTRRHGAVLLLTIVCVAVAMTILAGLVHVALLRHATQKNHIRAAQAACLVESGLDRAVARLAADPTYKGETWKITAAEFSNAASLADDQSALVRIEIKTVADNPDKREIHIQADYPDKPKLRARRSKQTTITLVTPAPEKTEPEKADPKKTEPKQPESKNLSFLR